MKIKLGIILVVAALGGCVIVTDREDWEGMNVEFGGQSWEERQNENHRYISRLQLGTDISLVRADLGEPDFTEAWRRDDADYTILRYRTQHRHSDGETTEDETTPLIFKGGFLVGWGESVLRQALHGAPGGTPMSQVPNG